MGAAAAVNASRHSLRSRPRPDHRQQGKFHREANVVLAVPAAALAQPSECLQGSAPRGSHLGRRTGIRTAADPATPHLGAPAARIIVHAHVNSRDQFID